MKPKKVKSWEVAAVRSAGWDERRVRSFCVPGCMLTREDTILFFFPMVFHSYRGAARKPQTLEGTEKERGKKRERDREKKRKMKWKRI